MRLIASATTAVAFILPIIAGAQLPLGFSASERLAPESSPNGLNTDVFTTLTHESFADHKLRIKTAPEGWCEEGRAADGKARRVVTGYLDAGPDRHLFFYYFDARNSPEKAPVSLWTNGGPGASSSMGLFMELGPCRIQPDGNSTKNNPHSWTENSNFIFIDQPAGVGYSYSTHGVVVGRTEQAAIDLQAFLVLFFEVAFPDLQGRDFYLTGESYGGRYLPLFASEIVHQNDLLAKQDKPKHKAINLKGVAIGNGLTDSYSMTTAYYEYSCTTALGLKAPILGIKPCIEMQKNVARCEKMINKACIDKQVSPDCEVALSWCQQVFSTPFMQAELNPYDVSKRCTTLAEDLCYPESTAIADYLNLPATREMLGVDGTHVGKFESIGWEVYAAFTASKDEMDATWFHVTGLLERGLKVLVYVGKYDWICNYVGNHRWTEKLEWSGKASFSEAKLRSWKSDGVDAGETKSHGPFTFATVKEAGHMVPLDQPQRGLDMFNRWLRDEDL